MVYYEHQIESSQIVLKSFLRNKVFKPEQLRSEALMRLACKTSRYSCIYIGVSQNYRRCCKSVILLLHHTYHVLPSAPPQSRPLPSFSFHFSSLLETPTCVSCLGPSVFPPRQPGKVAHSHNMGHQEINYKQQARAGLKHWFYSWYCSSHPQTLTHNQ